MTVQFENEIEANIRKCEESIQAIETSLTTFFSKNFDDSFFSPISFTGKWCDASGKRVREQIDKALSPLLNTNELLETVQNCPVDTSGDGLSYLVNEMDSLLAEFENL